MVGENTIVVSGWPSKCALVIACRTASRPEGLLQRSAHDEPVPGADAAHVLEQIGVAAAHHLHDAAVAPVAERAQHLDGVRALERDIEEDDVGMAALQRRDGVLRPCDSSRPSGPRLASAIETNLQMPSSSSMTKASAEGGCD